VKKRIGADRNVEMEFSLYYDLQLPSITPNTMAFNIRASFMRQMWPKKWSFLCIRAVADHNTEKTPFLWPHLPHKGRTNVKSHSVWCDGGQLHGKEDHVENGRMISRIGARRTCTH